MTDPGPSPVTVTELLERAAAADRGEVVIAETGERATLPELLAAGRMAAAELRRAGVRPGAPVGLITDNEMVFFPAFLGILYAGAVAVPLAIPSAMGGVEAYSEHLRRVLADSGMRHVVASRRCRRILVGRTPELPAGVHLVPAEELPAGEERLVEPGGAESLAVIQYTSGSTLAPRGVMLTHHNVVAGLGAIGEGCALTADDIAGLWVPLFHDMGLFSTLAALTHGLRVVLWRPATFVRRPAEWLEQFAGYGCTVTTAPNFCYDYLVDVADSVRGDLDLSGWRLALNGAEPVNARTVELFQGTYAGRGLRPHVILPVYGMAEATLGVTFSRAGAAPDVFWLDRADALATGRVVPAAPGTPGARPLVGVGRPVRGVRVRVGGDGAPEDVFGEVEITGEPVTAGYFRRPTGELFTADGWLRTGDQGFLHRGELYIAGRIRNMVVIRGNNYYAEDAEAIVRDLPGVYRRRCAAVGGEDERSERLVMVVETGVESSDQRHRLTSLIRSELSAGLGLFDIAVHLVPPQTMPRTSSGKVQRAKVRASLPPVI
ncbi:AMP-binding protein [Plantactinospora sp. WMMB334]|uniref:AMP-binding protein n=1 Tax=Plantactinospora sp. WMMB334 TaxID=3404119 RepID=UPI003B954DE6